MKKILIAIIVLILLAGISLYVLIPGRVTVSKSAVVLANRDALLRKIQDAPTWKQWWPGHPSLEVPPNYWLNGVLYKPGEPRALSMPFEIESNYMLLPAEITFLPHNFDSTTVHIETIVPVSANPFKRIRQYFRTKKLAAAFSDITQAIQRTYSVTANLYDFDIRKEKVADSILVSTFEETTEYPSANKVYELIDQLKSYIKQNDASETGLPMLNISARDSVNYVVRVAIPVNKRLPPSGKISYKWMLAGGNILITEVRGGQTEIQKAYKQIQNYIADHSRTPPAIPFESLVTDRRSEPDSSKWITRIYYPVM